MTLDVTASSVVTRMMSTSGAMQAAARNAVVGLIEVADGRSRSALYGITHESGWAGGLLQLQLFHESKIHPMPVPLSLLLGFLWLLGTGIDGKEWHKAP